MANRLAPLQEGYQNRQIAESMIRGAVSYTVHDDRHRTMQGIITAERAGPAMSEVRQAIGYRGPVSTEEIQTLQHIVRGARDGRY